MDCAVEDDGALHRRLSGTGHGAGGNFTRSSLSWWQALPGAMRLVGRDDEGREQWMPDAKARMWLPADQLQKCERDDDEIWRERAAHANRYMSILTKRELTADELNELFQDLDGICAIRKRGRNLYEDKADAMLSGDWDCLLVRAARWNRVETIDFCEMHGAGSVYEVPDYGINYEGDFVPLYEHCSSSGEWPLFAACLHGNVEMVQHILEGMVNGADDYVDTNHLVREHPIDDDFNVGRAFTAGATALNMLCVLPGKQAQRGAQQDNLLSRKLEIARLFFAKYSRICRLYFANPACSFCCDASICPRSCCSLKVLKIYTSMLRSLCINISTRTATGTAHAAFTVEMVKLVLEHGADPNQMVPDFRITTPPDATFSILFEACAVAHHEAELMRSMSWTRPADAERCYEAVHAHDP